VAPLMQSALLRAAEISCAGQTGREGSSRSEPAAFPAESRMSGSAKFDCKHKVIVEGEEFASEIRRQHFSGPRGLKRRRRPSKDDDDDDDGGEGGGGEGRAGDGDIKPLQEADLCVNMEDWDEIYASLAEKAKIE